MAAEGGIAGGGLTHEVFDLGRLAARFVLRVDAAAVNAVIAEATSSPDEIIERTLKLGDAVLEELEPSLGIGASGSSARHEYQLRPARASRKPSRAR